MGIPRHSLFGQRDLARWDLPAAGFPSRILCHSGARFESAFNGYTRKDSVGYV
jgi:hypothetical protein